MIGDGNFKWWCGCGSEPDSYEGPFDTRVEAVEIGFENWGGDFAICEADKMIVRPNFATDFIAERIMDDLCAFNEECWGEDGPEDPWSHDKQAFPSLEKAIQTAVSQWLADHPARTWSFNIQRSEEYFPAGQEGAGAMGATRRDAAERKEMR